MPVTVVQRCMMASMTAVRRQMMTAHSQMMADGRAQTDDSEAIPMTNGHEQ
jgi:hypothetical protein